MTAPYSIRRLHLSHNYILFVFPVPQILHNLSF